MPVRLHQQEVMVMPSMNVSIAYFVCAVLTCYSTAQGVIAHGLLEIEVDGTQHVLVHAAHIILQGNSLILPQAQLIA